MRYSQKELNELNREGFDVSDEIPAKFEILKPKKEIQICPWCKGETKKLFYNYKSVALCKTCLDKVLKESRKTLNVVRNFVAA